MLTKRQLSIIHKHTNIFDHGHIAFAFIGSRLIYVGTNKSISARSISTSIYTVHAEVSLLYQLTKKIEKFKIVSISTKKNRLKNGKPCTNCCERLFKYGVSEIIYSDENGIFKKENISDIVSKFSSGDYTKKLNFTSD